VASPFNFLLVRWAPTGVDDTYTVDATFPLPIGPEQTDYRAIMATAVRPTADGVDIQRAPQRMWDITLSGSTGLRERSALSRYGVPMRAPGPLMYAELVGFIQELGNTPGARLSWHDFVTQRQLWVEPTLINDGRGPTHTVDSKWSITLRGYGESGYPTGGLGFVLTLGARARAAIQTFDQWVSVVAATADLAAAAALEIAELSSEFVGLVDFVPDILEATSAVVGGTASVAEYPSATWSALSDRVDAALFDLSVQVARWQTADSENAETGVEARQTLRALQTSLDVAALSASELGQATVSPVTHEVRAGETLQSIAGLKLGDAARWPELAALNGLLPPYITAGGSPGTVAPGALLLLPYTTTDTEILGDDLDLAIAFTGSDVGDFVLEPGTEPADVQTVTGTASAIQALNVVIRTRQGEDTQHPAVGLPAAVGDVVSNAGIVLATLIDQILSDGRFVRVVDARAETVNNGIRLTVRPVLKSGKPLTPIGATVS